MIGDALGLPTMFVMEHREVQLLGIFKRIVPNDRNKNYTLFSTKIVSKKRDMVLFLSFGTITHPIPTSSLQ